MKCTGKVVVVAVSLWSGSAGANDTSAALSAGGLVFLQDDRVAMVAEDLTVTPDEIVVRYVFLNTSGSDVTTLVAFPLPELAAGMSDLDVAADTGSASGDVIGFETRVEGQPVSMQVEHRASLLGLDVTAQLSALGLAVSPLAADVYQRLAAISGHDRESLESAMLITAEGHPRWSFRTTYYWQQNFPAGAEIRIEHRYRPATGHSVDWPVGLWAAGLEPGEDARLWAEEARRDACADPAVEAQMLNQRAGATGLPEHTFGSATVDYILTTGANWAGPIERFRLEIQAAHPADFVFACFDGLRREGQGLLVADLTDFTPRQNLHVVFAEAYGPDLDRSQ